MKKQWILTLTVLMGTSLASAGTFQADDFNQMIKDNQKAETALRNQLQKEAGIHLDEKPGQIAKDKIVAPAEPEQVVVSSSQPLWKDHKDKSARKLDKADMKRISQELDEASN